MDIYASDEEKVEQLKQWWKENGRSLIAGVVLGVGVIVGWRVWVGYQANQAEQASALYQQMSTSINLANTESALETGRRVINDFSGSPYAVFASLAVAKLKTQQGESEAAAAHLRWAMNNADTPGFEHIVRLRLARVLLADGQADEALELVSGSDAGAFAAAYAEVRGDALRVRGDTGQAHAAYEQALQSLAPDSRNRALIQMKLDEVAAPETQEKS